jgi:hypothetical protein
MEDEEEVMFVTLQDGRRLAYREQGVTANDMVFQKSLLVLHGTPSSRLAGMPGNQTNETLLQTLILCNYYYYFFFFFFFFVHGFCLSKQFCSWIYKTQLP